MRGLPAVTREDLLFNEPGSGYFTIPSGTECRLLTAADIPAHRRGVLERAMKSHDGRTYVAVLLAGRARVVPRDAVTNLSEPTPAPTDRRHP